MVFSNVRVTAMLTIGIAVACFSMRSTAQVTGDFRDPRINTQVFECQLTGGRPLEFTVRRGPGELALWLPWEFERPYLVLSQVFDSADQVYREGDVLVKFETDTATLAIGSEQFAGCTENAIRSIWEHAKLKGVDFRAEGKAPDWWLEIRHGGQIVFDSEWRDTHIVTPMASPDEAGGTAVYHATADGRELVVTIGGSTCPAPDRDDMTGTLVTVSVYDMVFYGCGRALH